MAILLSVGCFGFWIPDCIEPSAVGWGTLVGTLSITILNALFFVLFIYQRGITRKLEGLPFFLYLFVISTQPILHTQWLLQIVVLIFQLILSLIMRSYRQAHAVEPAFLSAMLLCTAALILPDLLFLLPILWLMFLLERAMNLRVLLASLIGGSVVLLYTVLFNKLGWIHLVDMPDIWLRNTEVTNYPLPVYLLSACGLFFAIANLTHQNIENTSITIFVWCIICAFVPCALWMFFPPAYFASLFIIAVYCLIALTTYFFASRESVFAGIVFIVFCTLMIAQFFL